MLPVFPTTHRVTSDSYWKPFSRETLCVSTRMKTQPTWPRPGFEPTPLLISVTCIPLAHDDDGMQFIDSYHPSPFLYVDRCTLI